MTHSNAFANSGRCLWFVCVVEAPLSRSRIVQLRLANPDELLANRIDSIQKERQAARNLPFTTAVRTLLALGQKCCDGQDALFDGEGLDNLRNLFVGAKPSSALQLLFAQSAHRVQALTICQSQRSNR